MKKIMTGFMVFMISFSLFANVNLARADELFFHDDLNGAQIELENLLEIATANKDKAEILWRLSRNALNLGGLLAEDDKDGRFAMFEKGEEYAIQSYKLFENPDALVWQASNIGRWGQTKGVLNSLMKASDMREILTEAVNKFNYIDSSELWYTAGALYDGLPGGFLSFGDKVVAVSYMRLATETISDDVYYGSTYADLARYLYRRGWNQSKRTKEIAKIAKEWKDNTDADLMEQYKYYEGHAGISYVPFYTSKTIGSMSDREEAIEVLKYAIKKYDQRPFHLKADDENLQIVKDLLIEYSK